MCERIQRFLTKSFTLTWILVVILIPLVFLNAFSFGLEVDNNN